VPVPPYNAGGSPGSVGGGHTFATDVAARPYHGPGTYTGSGLTATQMDVDTLPGDQETHIFALPTGVGTLIVKPDASGSFQFNGMQDPGSVRISGQIIWTCSQPRRLKRLRGNSVVPEGHGFSSRAVIGRDCPECILFSARKRIRGQKERTSAAKAGYSRDTYGAAEAVPFLNDRVPTHDLNQ
jgi:hypothetical protein